MTPTLYCKSTTYRVQYRLYFRLSLLQTVTSPVSSRCWHATTPYVSTWRRRGFVVSPSPSHVNFHGYERRRLASRSASTSANGRCNAAFIEPILLLCSRALPPGSLDFGLRPVYSLASSYPSLSHSTTWVFQRVSCYYFDTIGYGFLPANYYFTCYWIFVYAFFFYFVSGFWIFEIWTFEWGLKF